MDVTGHTEPTSGHQTGLNLLLHQLWPLLYSNPQCFLSHFSKMPSFWVIIGSHIFQNTRLCCQQSNFIPHYKSNN